ncbi:MAG: homoserine O-acetyltransferase family protein [Myxococcota bacterium]
MITPQWHRHSFDYEFELDCGTRLPGLSVSYTTFGTLSERKDNVVWVCHTLTSSPEPSQWWPDLVGESGAISPKKYFIVCANVLGGCHGTTSPISSDPNTGQRYGMRFPLITTRDMARVNALLRRTLGIERICLGLGGSLGGQQLLEWNAIEPSVFSQVCLVAANAKHSAWGIAFNAAQRLAMKADPTLSQNTERAGQNGLRAARAIAMLSYRTRLNFCQTQTDPEPKLDHFKADSYQTHQGNKLAARFEAHAYWHLTKAMDSHDLSRNRGTLETVLATVQARTLSIGFSSDHLFHQSEQEFIANHIPRGSFSLIETSYGHDATLLESRAIADRLMHFLENDTKSRR